MALSKSFLLFVFLSSSLLWAQAPLPPCHEGLCVVFQVTITKEGGKKQGVKKIPKVYNYKGKKIYRYVEVYAQDKKSCSKKVLVPFFVYQSLQKTLSQVGAETSSPVLTPTQKAMLMFYSTIMKQTVGFQCPGWKNTTSSQAGGSTP